MRRARVGLVALISAVCVALVSGMAPALSAPVADLDTLLAAVSARVESYYARAQTIMCTETVRLQPLSFDLSGGGRARELVYDLRIAWTDHPDGADPEATILRQIRTVDGRPPKARSEPGCMDPKEVSPEPLEMLLAAHRGDYVFKLAGPGKVDGRAAETIDYRSIESGKPEMTWQHDDCFSISLPGVTEGRIWVDAETDDVLRLDQRLRHMVDLRVPPRPHPSAFMPMSMIVERADQSIHYRRIAFHNPEEMLTLPVSIDSLTVIRNSGVPRLRTTQVFSDYRRFVTDARIVKPGAR